MRAVGEYAVITYGRSPTDVAVNHHQVVAAHTRGLVSTSVDGDVLTNEIILAYHALHVVVTTVLGSAHHGQRKDMVPWSQHGSTGDGNVILDYASFRQNNVRANIAEASYNHIWGKLRALSYFRLG